MSTRSTYAVHTERYAERHYIKTFEKRYKGAWQVTYTALVSMLQRTPALIGKTNLIEIITDDGAVQLCKVEFAVAGTHMSPHASGNRCIVAHESALRTVRILLVYGKGDVRGTHETAWWKQVIRENYAEYKVLL